jgi:hypothetical protein
LIQLDVDSLIVLETTLIHLLYLTITITISELICKLGLGGCRVTPGHFRIWSQTEKRGNGSHIPTLGILHGADIHKYMPFPLP